MNAVDAARWLDFARSDLNTAKKLMEDADYYPRQVCFLAQQAAEKALKAVLIYLAIDFPYTHDLDRLREAIPAGWRVKENFAQLYGLSIWAVESRYPGDLPDVVSADADQALRLADALYQTVAEELHARFSVYPGLPLDHAL